MYGLSMFLSGVFVGVMGLFIVSYLIYKKEESKEREEKKNGKNEQN